MKKLKYPFNAELILKKKKSLKRQEYNLQITGLYNPYKFGMTDNDFYDARHVRHGALTKYFIFTSN